MLANLELYRNESQKNGYWNYYLVIQPEHGNQCAIRICKAEADDMVIHTGIIIQDAEISNHG